MNNALDVYAESHGFPTECDTTVKQRHSVRFGRSQMPKDTKRYMTVKFPSENKSISVAEGTTLLEACNLADIPIDAVCGGEGKCGRCKMRPRGPYDATPSPQITEAESKEGWVLGCLCRPLGDISVELMPRARIGKHQILTETTAEIPRPLRPWTLKKYVELQPPNVSDNVADLERLIQRLGTKRPCVPLDTLKELSGVLRSGSWKVTATISDLGQSREIIRVEPSDTTTSLLGLAIDIGTTTVVVELIDMLTGKTVATASDYNHQTSRGEDVIARMMYSEEKGVLELKALVTDTINALIFRALKSASTESRRSLDGRDISAVSVAGNSIMTHFFLGLDTRHIRLEPYVPTAYHIPCVSAKEAGLDVEPTASVFTFPSRAGYVGGDVVADVLTSGMHRSSGLMLLIDVGTNGEIVLGGKDWMAACACSAGPAFEGGEVSCGMRAMEGAIDKIRINDDLTTSYHVIGDERPVGICGSGLIDLIAEMYAQGIVDRKARIQALRSDRIQSADAGLGFVVERKSELVKGAANDLVVTDADLQNLLRTKAAIFGACSTLLRKTDERLDDVTGVVIAGGFGSHLDVGRSISIGMLPDVPYEKYRFIGNGSLGGARLALLSAKRRREVEDIFEKMTYFELSVDATFYEEFSSALFIPHTDLGRFPSAPKDKSGGAKE